MGEEAQNISAGKTFLRSGLEFYEIQGNFWEELFTEPLGRVNPLKDIS